MMNKLKLFSTYLCLMVALSCSNDKNEMTTTNLVTRRTPIQLTTEQQAFVLNNNDFAFNLFRTINTTGEEKGSNIVSPLSTTYLLGMLNTAADGTTRDEITRVLGFGANDPEAVNQFCKNMIESAPKADTGVTLNIANAILLNKGYALNAYYASSMENCYNAKLVNKDFSDPATLKLVNEWCSQQTHGNIPNIIDRIETSAIAYLLNAIYFKSTWTHAFDEKNTVTENFTLRNGNTTTVQMMHQKATVLAKNYDKMMMIRLPYSAGGFCMNVLLPEEGYTTYDIINMLSSDTWNEMNAYEHYSIYEVDIKMPRFITQTNLSLKEVLHQMGVQSAFDSNKAQLPHLCEKGNAFISEMRQYSSIEVNENGTEVKTITYAVSGDTDTGPSEQIRKYDFHANKPFVYVITESSTGAIFFIGTYQGN